MPKTDAHTRRVGFSIATVGKSSYTFKELSETCRFPHEDFPYRPAMEHAHGFEKSMSMHSFEPTTILMEGAFYSLS